MIQFDHLKKAREYSNLPSSVWFYFKHMWWALHLAFMCLAWFFAMVVHAFVPQLVGFSVIHSILNYIKELKRLHPSDPYLKGIEFND
jgi:hypothetical protein